ncbi:DUF6668 family protein [Arthrobacter sp. STN4]|uniref:DUF6668 family protein n=1 Tax=Arthrobacter sp. STN4 TaxID=2923276 RepID=UPI0028120CC9|nr:DUF6668 family protein [Arthrobacter sp. STN4]
MPVSKNRWISLGSEYVDDPAPAVVDDPSALHPTGPTKPQLSVPQPEHVDRLPRRNVPDGSADYWWLGVHGGAGESSLARLDKQTKAAGHHWPMNPAGSTIVLVARSNMHGLRAAQRAATEWASGSLPEVTVAGLVLSADAPGRMPKEIREFARVVGGGVPHLWHIPWIEEWRLGHEIPYELLPKDVRTVLDQVRSATKNTAGSPAK